MPNCSIVCVNFYSKYQLLTTNGSRFMEEKKIYTVVVFAQHFISCESKSSFKQRLGWSIL